MAILSTIILALAIIVAIVFSLLVLITGKGDAMSGSGGVRTTYKGKATFDDFMSQATLYLGIAFMALVLLYNVVSTRAAKQASMTPPSVSKPAPAPSTNLPVTPAANTPATNAPATNAPATNAPATASNNGPTTNAPASNAPATNAPATNAPAANNSGK